MPVMDVRVVRMLVRQHLMPMRVYVRLFAVPLEVVLMLMVLVVRVAMSMVKRHVRVLMLVPLPDMEPDPGDHQRGRRPKQR